MEGGERMARMRALSSDAWQRAESWRVSGLGQTEHTKHINHIPFNPPALLGFPGLLYLCGQERKVSHGKIGTRGTRRASNAFATAKTTLLVVRSARNVGENFDFAVLCHKSFSFPLGMALSIWAMPIWSFEVDHFSHSP